MEEERVLSGGEMADWKLQNSWVHDQVAFIATIGAFCFIILAVSVLLPLDECGEVDMVRPIVAMLVDRGRGWFCCEV